MGRIRSLSVAIASVALIGLVAAGCVKPAPNADGRALAEIHVQRLKGDDLTLDELVDDLNKARDRHETPQARRAFEDAYSEAMQPAQKELAEMLVDESGQRAAQAIRRMSQALGEEFRGFTRELSDAVRQLRGEKNEFREALRDFGREIGKTIKEVSEDVEAIADGIDEELDESK